MVKPVMSSSGKGQSTAKTAEEVGTAWDYAVDNMRGDRPRVIVEEFIEFDSEITLADRRHQGRRPVLRRRSAIARKPATIARAGSRRRFSQGALQSARHQARKVVEALGRPRHLRRRILHSRRPGDLLRAEPAPARHRHGHADLAIPERVRASPARDPRASRSRRSSSIGPSASAVILGDRESDRFLVTTESPKRLRSARRGTPVDLRIFAKPRTLKNRRMGVALARGETAEDAVERAKACSRSRQDSLSAAEGGAHASGSSTCICSSCAALAGCNEQAAATATSRTIKVTSAEQQQLHQLDAFNLAIGLKRAIYDAGYTCKRITDAGFVGTWQEPRHVDGALRLRQRQLARLGDLRRPRRQRPGARLQGRARKRPSRLRDQAAPEGQLHRQGNSAQPGFAVGLHWRVSLYSPEADLSLTVTQLPWLDFLAPAAVRIGHAIALRARACRP